MAQLATGQHGVVSRKQLLAAGHTPKSINHRIATGRLHRIHPGVYAVGHRRLLRYARYMAAVLASGDDAVVSHRAAATLHGLRPPGSVPIEVTTPRRGGRKRRDLIVYATRQLDSAETDICEGIPCTAPMRTLVDLAAVLQHGRQLRLAIERSLELNLFDRIAIDAVLAHLHGRRGTRLLRRLLADLPDEPALISSELERRFLELIRAAGLPYPVVNGYVGDLQVDFHWPAFKLVVETDGRSTHGHAIAFHRDRDRDLYLQGMGWRVLRLSWRQVVNEPERVRRVLSGLLAELGFGRAGLGRGALA